MKLGTELIAEERQRQIDAEGWTPDHDDEHTRGQLALAAVCYAYPRPRPVEIKRLWPWDRTWWKPSIPEMVENFHGREQAGDPVSHLISDDAWHQATIRDLVKAGALIAAEIDRIQRSETIKAAEGGGMKERPILFSGEMVRAILEGRKTQTRRVINLSKLVCLEPDDPRDTENVLMACPYGKPGDRLWVREAWADVTACFGDKDPDESPLNVAFKADNSVWNVHGRAVYLEQLGESGIYVDKWKPSIHMHRQSSRIALEITNVRVERVQDISDDDAIAEGSPYGQLSDFNYERGDAKQWFSVLWEKINGKKHPWASNPWVWVVGFSVLKEG